MFVLFSWAQGSLRPNGADDTPGQRERLPERGVVPNLIAPPRGARVAARALTAALGFIGSNAVSVTSSDIAM